MKTTTPIGAFVTLLGIASSPSVLAQNAITHTDSPAADSTETAAMPTQVAIAQQTAIAQQAEGLMKDARIALIEHRDFDTAALLYQRILTLPHNPHSAAALEYLGLTLERQDKYAAAIATYQSYLRRYPASGEAASSADQIQEQELAHKPEPSQQQELARTRVTQRLNSLLSATDQPRPALKSLQRPEDKPHWESWGSWSQYLRYDLLQISGGDMENTAAMLSNDLELSISREQGTRRDRLRISAGYYADLDEEEGGGSGPQRTRISSLYLDHKDRYSWLNAARLGRFTSQRDGTLGRYDGVKLEFGLSDTLNVGMVGGYPVTSSRDSFGDTLGSQRRFAGLSVAWSPWEDGPDIALYSIEQTDSGLVDRRAVGGEIRYFDDGLTLFGVLDYDIHFQQLNIGLLHSSWTLDNHTILTGSYDVRQSPILTSHNALAGQIDPDGLAITDLDTLQQHYSDTTIYQLAQDRTAQTQTLTLAASVPLSQSFTWASDLSISRTGATTASGGVAATPDSGLQTYFNTRLTGLSWLNAHDITTLGLRRSDNDTLQTTGGYATHRLPIGKQWRVYSRFQIEQRQWHTSSQQQQRILPALRLDYRHGQATLEAEISGEWIDTQAGVDSLTGDEQSTGWFFTLGYRYDF